MLGLDSVGTPALWVGFGVFVLVMLALDLGVFNRKTHAISAKEAALWSAVWVAMALAFNGVVLWKWGGDVAQAFLTGYLLEKALSVDNLFVFYLIFAAFAVPLKYQHKLLFYGVLGALVLRLLMVVGGSWLLARFHFLVLAFGVVLIWTGVRMFRRHDDHPHPENSRLFRWFKRVVRTTEQDHGAKFFARENGVIHATPLLLVLVLIEATDVVFALDSILAIFAITEDPFIVFTSNIFAVMGLRSLYFLLAGVASRFVYLQPGLAIVLMFVGAKMAASQWVKVPVLVSLSVIVLLLGGSIAASIIKERRAKKGQSPLPAPHPSH